MSCVVYAAAAALHISLASRGIYTLKAHIIIDHKPKKQN